MTTKGEYKGHATLTLTEKAGDRYGLTFGLAKARLILENLDAIRAFVAEDDARAAASLQAKIDADDAARKAKAA